MGRDNWRELHSQAYKRGKKWPVIKISNVEAVVKQTLIFVESYAIELGCNDYANFDNNGVWFGCFEPSWR